MLDPARRPSASVALLFAGFAVLSLTAPKAQAAEVSVRAYEGFQGARLHTWQPGQMAVRLRRGADRDGEFVPPRSRRPMVVLRRLDAADRVELRFSFQRRGGGPQTLALLERNRVTLRVTRRGVLTACRAARPRCRSLGRTHRGRARWNRARLVLDVGKGMLRARLGERRTIRLPVRAHPEHLAEVGDVDREMGGPIAFDDIVLVAQSPAPAPVAQASPPLPSTPAPVAPASARMPPTGSSSARFFAPDSVWNAPLADDAPLDRQSAAVVGAFRAEIAREMTVRTGPWIATTEYSTPVYTVPAGQPRVRVTLDQPFGATLKGAFASVPLPDNARPASGTDAHLTVHQPSTDSLWEFWQLRRLSDGWHASWGGAMSGVSGSAGYYSSASWPGAESNWGATATSLPVIGGTMLLSELAAGRIDHALAIGVPDARAGVFAFPAQRTDGTSADPLAIPEGARLRLDPALNIDALGLPPLVRAMAVAAQRYGIIVRDKTTSITTFYGEDPTPTGTNPYPQLLGGRLPNDELASFPWDHLQLLSMQLTPAG